MVITLRMDGKSFFQGYCNFKQLLNFINHKSRTCSPGPWGGVDELSELCVYTDVVYIAILGYSSYFIFLFRLFCLQFVLYYEPPNISPELGGTN